jgi:thiamine biosynthesis lipoprotein
MTLSETVSFPAFGTTACVVTTAPKALGEAMAVLKAQVEAIDAAASRFRHDSEISMLARSQGRPMAVSHLMLEAVEAALRAARLSEGLVDPTVGRALRAAGYDRDFATVEPEGPALLITFEPVPGWRSVEVDRVARTVRLPVGVELDLGATAKALCADRAAHLAAEATGAGVLVSLGGTYRWRGRHLRADGRCGSAIRTQMPPRAIRWYRLALAVWPPRARPSGDGCGDRRFSTT